MPAPNKKKKKYGEYSKYLESSIRGNRTSGNNAKNLKSLRRYLKKLNDEISKCYEMGVHGQYRQIGSERLKTIKDLYKLCDFYASAAIKNAADNKLTKTLVSQLHDVLKEDQAYVNCLDENSIFPKNFRRNIVKLNSEELRKVGDRMNSRNPITYVDENGNKAYGFFTQNYDNDKADKVKYDAYRRELAEIVENIKKDPENVELRQDLQDAREAMMMGKDEFMSQAAIFEEAGIDYGCNITNRNCAMTNIANLLGLNELVAQSHSMTVYDEEGKKRDGVFMETGSGVIYEKLIQVASYKAAERQVQDEIEPDAVSLSSPKLKKNLADMQILDFICGNTDRHQKNMTYIFDNPKSENPKLIGVQGIDNDLSMGILDDGINYMLPLKKLHFISESLAAKIRDITNDDLKYVLQGLKLTNQEIEAACVRVGKIKECLKTAEIYQEDQEFQDGVITIIPDDCFAKIPFPKFCLGENRENENYFDGLKRVPKLLNVDVVADKITKRELKEGKYKDKPAPELILNYEDEPVLYTKAKLTRLDFSKEVIERNRATVESFKKKLEDLARNSKTKKIEIKEKRSDAYKEVYRTIGSLCDWYQNYNENDNTRAELTKRLKKAAGACMDYISAHNPNSTIGKKRQKAITDIMEFVGTQGIKIDEYHAYVKERYDKEINKKENPKEPKENKAEKQEIRNSNLGSYFNL